MIISKESDINLIIPADATQREIFAADELNCFLKSILSCAVFISEEISKTAHLNIILGGPSRNRYAARYIEVAEFNRLVPGPEGIFIKSYEDNTILLAGSESNSENECERGTLYAVYEFLERYFDISFAQYTNGLNTVLQRDKIELSDIFYIKEKADLPYRTAIVQYGHCQGNPHHGLNVLFLDWLIRNRYNRILTWSGIYEGYLENGIVEEAKKRGLRFSVGHHAAAKLFLPPDGNKYFPEKYYETHPEYYKLTKDGKRFSSEKFDGQWIYCSRNQELIETISQNIITWIGKNPAVDVIAFWPQDGIDEQCQCEKCSRYSKVLNYTYFMNEVAKRVGSACKHVKIDMLVYVDLWNPPEELQLEPNLMIDEATWHDTGLRKGGAPDGSAIIGTVFDNTILQWKALGADVVFYDYYMAVYSGRNRLVPIADEIQAISRYYLEKGIGGSGTQIECFNVWNHLFNFYCFARTMYDTSLSMENHLTRFIRIFGDGGEYITQIIRNLEACVDNRIDVEHIAVDMMKRINKEEIYGLYEKALCAAKHPYQRNNIRMMRMVFRYTDIETTEFSTLTVTEYKWLQPYPDETGELYFLSKFDSFLHNNPGYGIAIPVDCEKTDTFVPDKWYQFE